MNLYLFYYTIDVNINGDSAVIEPQPDVLRSVWNTIRCTEYRAQRVLTAIPSVRKEFAHIIRT